jgi:hypothetical protein
MTRGAGTSGRAVKKPSRKAATPSRTPKTARRSAPSTPSIDDLQAQLNEASAREAATAEVLRVISSTPGELQLVFRTILENAIRICEATFGGLALCEGDDWRQVATQGASTAYVRMRTPETTYGSIRSTHWGKSRRLSWSCTSTTSCQ